MPSLKWSYIDPTGNVVEGKECKKCKDQSLRETFPCRHPSLKFTCCTPSGTCKANDKVVDAVKSKDCATGPCPDPRLADKRPCLHRSQKKCCDYNLRKCLWMTQASYENTQKIRPTLGTKNVNGAQCEFAGEKNGTCPSSHPFKVGLDNLHGWECTTSRKCARGYKEQMLQADPSRPNLPDTCPTIMGVQPNCPLKNEMLDSPNYQGNKRLCYWGHSKTQGMCCISPDEQRTEYCRKP